MADPGHRSDRARTRAGIFYSLGAYTLWGLLPLYLRQVREVPPFEFLMHRVVWSVALVLPLVAGKHGRAWRGRVFPSGRVLGGCAASAAVLSLNWFLYVWSVDAGRVVDASLGYFINPLLNVGLGALVLKERLSRTRWAAVGLAFLGVCWLTFQFKQVPWIGLGLATSFATYGLLRKIAALGSLEGLAAETLLLLPVAMGTLGYLALAGQSAVVNGNAGLKALVLLAGPVTAVPLLLFAAGTRRIPLSLVGLLQYVGPTLQLLVGIHVGHEAFGSSKAIGYAFIWAGCLLAAGDGLLGARRRQAVPLDRPTVRALEGGRAAERVG